GRALQRYGSGGVLVHGDYDRHAGWFYDLLDRHGRGVDGSLGGEDRQVPDAVAGAGFGCRGSRDCGRLAV
ncbi:MAG: hypothetical protein E7E68_11790, partial [Staphylococcus sp.]|nr:hypothetical protein [Staphylococcus sp.]